MDNDKIKEFALLTGKPEEEIQQAFNSFKEVIDKLYEVIKPIVNKIHEFIKAVKEGFEKFWNSLDNDTKQYIIAYYRMKERIKERMKRQHMVAYTIRSNDNWNYQRMNIES
jgi:hypothetical protein